LLDNNFLASPKWKEKLLEIIDRGIKVSFCQGLDIRLITQENARLLAESGSYDWKFKEKRWYFAFDSYSHGIWIQIQDAVKILEDAGVTASNMMFYMLCGFDTSHEKDMLRFRLLDDLGVDPFVMRYNNRRDDVWLNHFARWVDKRIYKACEFEEYTRLPKEFAPTTTCR